MNILKTLVVLMVVWTFSPGTLFADLLKFRIAGTVRNESTGGRFSVGHPYTLTVTVDTATPGVPVLPEWFNGKCYSNAITSFVFNYDSGAYMAQGSNQGDVTVSDNDRGLYDHFYIDYLTGFPPVAGQLHSGTWFSLTDTSALVFASTDLPRILNADGFQSQTFQISWGIDWDAHMLFLSVENITLVERRPEITAWSRSTNALILGIEFPGKPYTNILERSFGLGPSEQWDAVAVFISSGGNTNWTEPLQMDQPAVFYRMRP